MGPDGRACHHVGTTRVCRTKKSNHLHASCVCSVQFILKKNKDPAQETSFYSPATPCPAGCKGPPPASRQSSNWSPRSSSCSRSCGRTQVPCCSPTCLHSVKRKLPGTSFGSASAQLGHFHFKHRLDCCRFQDSSLSDDASSHSPPSCQNVQDSSQDGTTMLQVDPQALKDVWIFSLSLLTTSTSECAIEQLSAPSARQPEQSPDASCFLLTVGVRRKG